MLYTMGLNDVSHEVRGVTSDKFEGATSNLQIFLDFQ